MGLIKELYSVINEGRVGFRFDIWSPKVELDVETVYDPNHKPEQPKIQAVQVRSWDQEWMRFSLNEIDAVFIEQRHPVNTSP